MEQDSDEKSPFMCEVKVLQIQLRDAGISVDAGIATLFTNSIAFEGPNKEIEGGRIVSESATIGGKSISTD
jgi:hypothetical protein